jgi:hypothetical protein
MLAAAVYPMKPLVFLTFLALVPTRASAQSVLTMGPADAVNPNSLVEGNGIKVGEGTVIHPILALETGIVSNVFFEEAGPNTAGLLRLLAEIQTGTLPKERLVGPSEETETDQPQPSWQYDLRAFASWDQYLSTNSDVTHQGGLGGGLLFRGVVKPGDPLNFTFMEGFNRVLRAANFESPERTNRDINNIHLRLAYQPRGRSIGGYLYYQNLIDVFEDDNQQFANRMQHTIGARLNYQLFPLTRLYTEISQGLFGGLGAESRKVDSYPLTAVVGIQTSLTLKTTFNARIGYTNGFYSTGPSYSAVDGGVQFGYRYSPMGRITALYNYNHSDSINANFFRDHTLAMNIEQMFVPFVLVVRPEFHLRQYQGVDVMSVDGATTRDDVILSITAGARYNFRNWIAATADYTYTGVFTDFRYTDASGSFVDDPGFSRHEFLAGLRVAY